MMTTQTPPQTLFAKKAVAAIRELVSATRHTLSKKFSGILESRLSSTADYLEDLKDTADAACLSQVGRLLVTLENMSKFPSSFLAINDPSDLHQYANLQRIVDGQPVRKWLQKLGKKEKQLEQKQKKILASLSQFTTKTTTRDLIHSDLDSNVTNIERLDCQVYTRNLYGVLSPLCVCSSDEKEERITANLELTRWCSLQKLPHTQNPPKTMEFRVFLRDHPHHNMFERAPRWKDVNIQVPRKDPRKKRVQFTEDAKTPTPPTKLRVEGNLISTGTFCKVITDERHSQLQLVVSRDGHVVSQPDKPCLDAFILDRASISLAELLQYFNTQLLNSHRILLLYVLAKSFWQLYDSEWMCHPWTKEDIHFMVKSWSEHTVGGRFESKTGIYICEPFLSTPFKCSYKEPKDCLHPFPKLLALGIMFLEILLGQGLENWPEPGHFDESITATVNADFYIADRAFKEARERNGSVAHMGQVIDRCISPTYFFARCKKNVESLREAIQKDVVNVLHASYNDFSSGNDADAASTVRISLSGVEARVPTVQRINCASSSPVSEYNSFLLQQEQNYIAAWKFGALPAMRGFHTELPSGLQFSRPMAQPVSCYSDYYFPLRNQFDNGTMSKEVVSSNEWFQRFEILGRVLRQKTEDRLRPAVKITVLDTGVLHDYKGLVEGYKDFVSGSDLKHQDLTGHGTEAVLLIRRMYHAAKIYVGRVFERGRAVENTSYLMSQAVLHAIKEWKTDIIVISSGFEKPCTWLDAAMKAAFGAGVLIFAAASNYGNLTDIAFPARLYSHFKLFCMFATTASIRATCGFNPTPYHHAPYNFAIFGEDVEIPFLNVTKSGTSYSAMIGAGLAGLILDFARHETAEGREHRLEKLSTVEGMSAVFAAMAKNKDNGYDCIAPWKILSEDVRDECVNKAAARKDVLDKMVAALRDCHLVSGVGLKIPYD